MRWLDEALRLPPSFCFRQSTMGSAPGRRRETNLAVVRETGAPAAAQQTPRQTASMRCASSGILPTIEAWRHKATPGQVLGLEHIFMPSSGPIARPLCIRSIRCHSVLRRGGSPILQLRRTRSFRDYMPPRCRCPLTKSARNASIASTRPMRPTDWRETWNNVLAHLFASRR